MEKPAQPEETKKPFGSIALSLSGGGYRAAAFHLGTMDLLDRLNLLQDVTMLSTVSGGTLAGAKYVQSLKSQSPFKTFFREFQDFLRDKDLLRLGLEELGRLKPRPASPRCSLIRAFAEVYNRHLFAGERFKILWEEPEIHLKEITFNATEFRTGVAFRFRKSENPLAKIGNGNCPITAAQAMQARLADITAASSCFPGGFEPIAFPDDFHWPENEAGQAAWRALHDQFQQPLPLMDGGVFDNQGIESLLLASGEPPDNFGMFIFSDTHLASEALYEFPAAKRAGWLTLGGLKVIWWLLLILAVICLTAAAAFLGTGLSRWQELFYLLAFLMSGGVLTLLIWARMTIARYLERIPKLKQAAWRYFRKLTLLQVADLVHLRISSLFALAGDVFMKRIRRLVFDQAFKDERFRNKLVPNLIYSLAEGKQTAPPLDWLQPSEAMRQVVAAANAMPTTLWFEQPQQLRNLVACGQTTMCFNLLAHIVRVHGSDPALYSSQVRSVYEKAQQHYLAFKANPYVLSE